MFSSSATELDRLSVLLGEERGNNELLRRSQRRLNILEKFGYQPLFERAGQSPPQGIILLIWLLLLLGISLVFLRFIGLAGLLTIPIALFVYRVRLIFAARRRSELFERDYTAFLLSLSSSIRTGLDPLVAFIQCGKLFASDSVLALEVEKTARDIESGKGEDLAFGQFARTIQHPDIGLLRGALILSRRQGSSLGSCLHRLAKVTRQRQSFRRKTRGAVAMQRLSAFGIAGCTVVVGLIQGTSNPEAIREAWEHPMGCLALSGGLGLVLFGLGWMLYMSRRRL